MELFINDKGHLWAHCHDCGFSGTGIDLMGHIRHTNNLKEIVQELINASALKSSETTTARIAEYEADKERRDKFDKFWQSAHSEVVDAHKFDAQLFEAIGVYPENGGSTRRGVFPYIGSCTGVTLDSALSIKSPIHGRRRITVIPYYNAPGNPVALAIMYMRHGYPTFKFHNLEPKASGLCCYESLVGHTTAILVESPLDILWLQNNNSLVSTEAIPVIGYLPDTNVWPIVNKTPLFFFRELTFDALLRAKSLPNAKICTIKMIPRFTTASTLPQDLLRFSVPWIRAVYQYVIDKSVIEAEHILLRLELTPDDADQLLQQAETPRDRERMSAVLGRAIGARTVKLSDRTEVIQTESGWYKTTNSDRVQVSNATFSVDTCVVYPTAGTHYSGSLVVYGKQPVRFIASEEELVNDSASFMRRVMNEHTLGTLSVLRGWATRLWELAQLFSPSLTQVHGKDTSGWNPDGSFSIGQVLVANGELGTGPLPVGVCTPMSKLADVQASKQLVAPLMADTYENKVFWALVCGLAASINYSMNPEALPRLSVIGGTNVVRKMVADLGLNSATFGDAVPGFCKHEDVTWEVKNVITASTWTNAHTLRGPQSVFIPLQYEPAQITTSWMPAAPVLMEAIKVMQIDPLATPVQAVGEALFRITGDQPDIVNAAEALLRFTTPYGRNVSTGVLLMYSMFSAISDERLKIMTVRSHKHLTLMHEHILIPLQLVRAMNVGASREEIATDLHTAGVLHTENDFELVLDKRAWERAFSDWRKLVLL